LIAFYLKLISHNIKNLKVLDSIENEKRKILGSLLLLVIFGITDGILSLLISRMN